MSVVGDPKQDSFVVEMGRRNRQEELWGDEHPLVAAVIWELQARAWLNDYLRMAFRTALTEVVKKKLENDNFEYADEVLLEELKKQGNVFDELERIETWIAAGWPPFPYDRIRQDRAVVQTVDFINKKQSYDFTERESCAVYLLTALHLSKQSKLLKTIWRSYWFPPTHQQNWLSHMMCAMFDKVMFHFARQESYTYIRSVLRDGDDTFEVPSDVRIAQAIIIAADTVCEMCHSCSEGAHTQTMFLQHVKRWIGRYVDKEAVEQAKRNLEDTNTVIALRIVIGERVRARGALWLAH